MVVEVASELIRLFKASTVRPLRNSPKVGGIVSVLVAIVLDSG